VCVWVQDECASVCVVAGQICIAVVTKLHAVMASALRRMRRNRRLSPGKGKGAGAGYECISSAGFACHGCDGRGPVKDFCGARCA